MDRLLQTSQKGVGHPLARTVGGQLIKKTRLPPIRSPDRYCFGSSEPLPKHLFLASRPCDAVNGDGKKIKKELSARSSVLPLPLGFGNSVWPRPLLFHHLLFFDRSLRRSTEQGTDTNGVGYAQGSTVFTSSSNRLIASSLLSSIRLNCLGPPRCGGGSSPSSSNDHQSYCRDVVPTYEPSISISDGMR